MIIILQEYPYECGVACLAMIGAFYGKNTRLDDYRKLFDFPTQRQSFADLQKAAAKISLEAIGVNVKELSNDLIFPCVAQVEVIEGSLHFVVIYSVDKKIILVDPAHGLRQIPKDIFIEIFTGNILIFRVRNDER